jgi:hypothetical protein
MCILDSTIFHLNHKKMRLNYLFLSLAFSLMSCNTSEAKKSENGLMATAGTPPGGTPTNSTTKTAPKSNGFWEKLVMHEVKDNNGVVTATVPMPATWKIVKGGITGPHGIKVTDFPFRSFMINYNPSLAYGYAASGQKMRELPDIETLIQQDFVPVGAKNGLTYIKSYELPEVSKIDKWYSDQLFKAMPSVSTVKAYGTEWRYANGNPYFLVIHLNSSKDASMHQWFYVSSGLDAEPAYFETAKKQFIFALANIRFNIEPIMAYNQAEAQRCGQSWAAFNKKMAANQAAFEANQIAHINKSNAINNAIMSNYQANDIASDKKQQQTIDGIYEQTNVQNTETGKTYKVQEGANQYWMNSNGEYIATKLQDYNPNLDDNMNEVNWQELKKVKK